MITKTERTELRQIVRQQFKVLRAELEQRQVEMIAGLEDEIAEKFRADDEQWAALQHRVHELVMEANRGINDALYESGYTDRGTTERMWLSVRPMSKPDGSRIELRRHAQSRIAAQVKAAQLDLDRREADTLRSLAVGAIESEEARTFLESIPTVGELVPTTRLAELESALRDAL